MQPEFAAHNVATAIITHLAASVGHGYWHLTECVQTGPAEVRLIFGVGGSTPYEMTVGIDVKVQTHPRAGGTPV